MFKLQRDSAAVTCEARGLPQLTDEPCSRYCRAGLSLHMPCIVRRGMWSRSAAVLAMVVGLLLPPCTTTHTDPSTEQVLSLSLSLCVCVCVCVCVCR